MEPYISLTQMLDLIGYTEIVTIYYNEHGVDGQLKIQGTAESLRYLAYCKGFAVASIGRDPHGDGLCLTIVDAPKED